MFYTDGRTRKMEIEIEGSWVNYNPTLTHSETKSGEFVLHEYVLCFRNVRSIDDVSVRNLFIFIKRNKNDLTCHRIQSQATFSDDIFRITLTVEVSESSNMSNEIVYVVGGNGVIKSLLNNNIFSEKIVMLLKQ
jgi:hypothetical protein